MSQKTTPPRHAGGSHSGTSTPVTPTRNTHSRRDSVASMQSPAQTRSGHQSGTGTPAGAPRTPVTPRHSLSPSAATQQGITEAMSSMSVASNNIKFAERPKPGVNGPKVDVLTNHFALNLSNMGDIHEYSFTVENLTNKNANQPQTNRYKRRVIFLLLNQHRTFRNSVSDYQSSIWTYDRLTPSRHESNQCTVSYYEEAQNPPGPSEPQIGVKVIVTFRKTVLLEPLRKYVAGENPKLTTSLDEYLTLLNMIIGRNTNQNPEFSTKNTGTKFFNRNVAEDNKSLGYGLQAFRGFYLSVGMTQKGLLLNLNTTTSPFYKSVLLDDLIKESFSAYDAARVNRYRLGELQRFLKLLRVRPTYLGNTHSRSIQRIAPVARDLQQNLPPSGANVKFERNIHPISQKAENIGPVTVNRHFKEAYPTVTRGNLNAYVVDVGSEKRPCFIPADLLWVLPGQPFKAFMPHPDQTSEMITFACRRPADNQKSILTRGLSQITLSGPNSPQDLFKLLIRNKMENVCGRRLPSAKIQYRSLNNKISTQVVDDGKWNMQNKRFYQPAAVPVIRWTCLEFLLPRMQPAANLTQFEDQIARGLASYFGLKENEVKASKYSSQPGLQFPQGEDAQSILKDKFEQLHKPGVRIVFVILPDKSIPNYALLKRVTDTLVGIHTICTVRKKGFVRTTPGEIANLLLKFNQKLRGNNLSLNIDAHKAILGNNSQFFGLDVTHPGTGAMKGAPSAVGMVGSVDQQFQRYGASIRLQSHQNAEKKALEMIADVAGMTEERLLHYKTENKKLPDRLFIFRDGVGDSMFSQVFEKELPQIRQACLKVYGQEELAPPKIVLIVVQKRHHVRFYKNDDDKYFDRNQNLKPGFVLDTGVASERWWDFYMVSHACIQGTARPAKYTVLLDEVKMTSDQLQLLIHHMCILLGRSLTSISVHPAARLADLLCDRVRLYLYDVYNPEEEGMVYQANQHWNNQFPAYFRNTMFYI